MNLCLACSYHLLKTQAVYVFVFHCAPCCDAGLCPSFKSCLPHAGMELAGFRVLIYSGDTDGVVPTLATRLWVESLGLKPSAQLRPWVDPEQGEVGALPQAEAWTSVPGGPHGEGGEGGDEWQGRAIA